VKIHLIGIGGIGVSALAQYYLSKGHQVSGSDLATSEITDFLKRPKNGYPGIKIIIGNYVDNIKKDIHDRVNYATRESKIKVDKEKKRITLVLKIDTNFCPIIEYFEIIFKIY
jgi:UDP-N-acetylmuramate-alanine ligase